VHLNVYDAMGRLVKAIARGTQVRGSYQFDVDTKEWPVGVYTAVLKTSAEQQSVKITVQR
jgi:hypothetical protein